MPNLQEQIAGGLVGLLVGDALGVPYEFHPAGEIPEAHEIEYQPPAGFDRAHKGVPPGTWSDDGAQALCLLDTLLECGGFDSEEFGRRLLRWQMRGYLAVDGMVFDIGITTHRALQKLRAGVPAFDAGPDRQNDNGNGALMRVLPLALWHMGSDAELVCDAELQSRVTHGHLLSQVCCALHCLWARCILEEANEPWQESLGVLRETYADKEDATEELEWHVQPEDDWRGGSGYVVDCLRSARWVAKGDSFEQVVRGHHQPWQRYRYHGLRRRRHRRAALWNPRDSCALARRLARS